MADMDKFSGSTYAAAKKYVEESLDGIGALAGKPCVVKNIDETTPGQHVITLGWTSDSGVEQEQSFTIYDGEKGATGATGAQGPSGQDGEDGVTYTPVIGTVTTLNAGQPATASVTADPTTGTATFNFGIPKGQDGTGSQTQSDWNQSDSTQPDYIKNKPDTTALQPKTMSSSVTIGAETETTVEGAVGEIASIIPSTATTSNKLATMSDISGGSSGGSYIQTDLAAIAGQNIRSMLTYPSGISYDTTAATIEINARIDSMDNNLARLVQITKNTSGDTYLICLGLSKASGVPAETSDYALNLFNQGSQVDVMIPAENLKFGDTHTFSLVLNNNVCTVYVDGAALPTTYNFTTLQDTLYYIYLMYGSYAGRIANGLCNSFRYYTRALTATEVLSNYQVDIGAALVVDAALSSTSTNPVQNRIIKSALDAKENVILQTSALSLTVNGWDSTTKQQTITLYPTYSFPDANRNVIDITFGQEETWADCGVYPVSTATTTVSGVVYLASITFECEEVPEDALSFTVTNMGVS